MQIPPDLLTVKLALLQQIGVRKKKSQILSHVHEAEG